MAIGEAHRRFYEHLLNGGTVHRDDKLNNVKEDLTLESLGGDATRIRLYGYRDLSIKCPMPDEVCADCGYRCG